jgi:signal transduction histidine kinase
MDDRAVRLLLVEDDPDDYVLTRAWLSEIYGDRFHLDWAADYDAALAAMERPRHDVYLIDYRLGARDGLALLREAVGRGCTTPIILLTGQGDREIDVEATREGAADYLVKGKIDAESLERSIRYAIERKRTEDALRRARAELEDRVRERTSELARANAELQQHVEKLNEAKEAAEAASRAKDTLLAVVSHELRTPLTPALVATTALLELGGLDDATREMMETVERSLRSEARLIDDLLDAMRIIRGKMSYRFEAVDVHRLIEQSAAACTPRFEAAAVGLARDLRCANPLVRGDADRLRQVVCNLLENAAKFTPAGGRVTVAARNEGPRVVVSVRDTGVGIDREDLHRIFGAFEQGERSPIRRFGGLGLGLAISRGIVEAHGGRLEARSEGEGAGAEFLLDLEAISGAADPGGVAGGSPPAGRASRLRIFFVEDDATTRELLARVLRIHGYEVRPAGTYREAIELADGEFDLVLSDIALPDGSGWDVMRHVRSRWGHIPGIAMSGFGSQEDRDASCAAGFATHLTKPVPIPQLRAMIERVAGR